MSLLDAIRFEQEHQAEVQAQVAPLIEQLMELPEIKNNAYAQGLKEGLSYKDMLEIPDEDMEAMCSVGTMMLRNGEIRKAKDIFQQLMIWDPLNQNYIYCMASALQISGDLQNATNLYIKFLALDATNPTAYLRLGECLMANQEWDYAGSFFRIAVTECERGNGTDEEQAYGHQMLQQLDELSSSAVIAEQASGEGDHV